MKTVFPHPPEMKTPFSFQKAGVAMKDRGHWGQGLGEIIPGGSLSASGLSRPGS